MRIQGEMPPEKEEEEKVKSLSLSIQQPQKLVVVGYALTSKKKRSFLQPKLEVLARNKGILFVAIDLNRPLLDQGPFDVVLHKLVGKDWCGTIESFALPSHPSMNLDQMFEVILSRTLTSKDFTSLIILDDLLSLLSLVAMFHSSLFEVSTFFAAGIYWLVGLIKHWKENPEVAILDPPDAIEHLLNRQSMLNDVTDLNLSDCHGKVCVPRQMVINSDPSSIPHQVTRAGLKLPLVAKPLVVDGTAKSHELFLAYDHFSLSELEPPLVLQEFVNHGGVLFKIYIVGEAIKVVRRFSLPNVTKQELSKVEGVFRFPRVSSAAASADDADLDPSVAGEILGNILLLSFRTSSPSLTGEACKGASSPTGYGKMPDYEHIFTDFLLSLMRSKYKDRPVQ
ncbi:hypothetical protein SADUNF_Sadunf09G0068100 [Salix dunnii]|uniref:Inositol-tetrakisphosphate 1-kinase n=1 Tax=Salix dunnii TaxID=1413687 RepID=A0A835JTC9_9ROSI|nr:hypothetical protein SADUNF_Sadunf09G0068100 [Salix dunnii]